MSLAPPPSSGPDRAASTLSLELPSNNPFRKSSIPSPAIPSPDSLPPNGRPVSRNPFLADFEQATEPTQKSENAPLIRTMSPPDRSSPVKTSFGKDAKDSFENLSINEKPPIRSELHDTSFVTFAHIP
ncbi:hypothetical protein P152DRAFT_127042 [Eremomyces bilateralis CBS 781.70]|uniref:Uncharacterized protein n=1 Tax=Eremomyces bilateralis CBS 781.70 TaxID=1392243 RepID=A0A6G1GEP2_9PEZI|nr:uncharacterized protein P152DRAFT_127042 [Eremomyces bilateralis CBS 781.70]KAF1816523.1 hypothetical protein P152DRAFT_127042 [Eremomyces bilateralis CBS 781.70]